MIRKFPPFAILLLALTPASGSAFGEESAHGTSSHADSAASHVHGSHIECPLPKSTFDVLRCVQEEHPKVQRAKLALAQAKGLSGAASQFKNPEVEVESASGTIHGEKQGETKVALLVPVEIGGKRSARRFEAESQAKHSEAELFETQADVVMETAEKLHRVRQLEQEKHLLQEAVQTFSQVVSQQKSRPGLAPEQKVALSVFRMALAEAKIRQNELFEEEKGLEHYFHVSTGHSLTELRKVLPAVPKTWPSIGPAVDLSRSPGIMKSRAELDLAIAQLKSAQAESWPELRLGPMMQVQREGANQGTIFGFQLSMDLPLFSVNGGGRDYARLGETKANRIVALTQAEETHEREEQVKVYERTVQTLKDAPGQEELDREHRQHEGFARRGLVSAPLIIESHRQIEELTRSRHSQELKALRALWRVYKFDGRALTEAL